MATAYWTNSSGDGRWTTLSNWVDITGSAVTTVPSGSSNTANFTYYSFNSPFSVFLEGDKTLTGIVINNLAPGGVTFYGSSGGTPGVTQTISLTSTGTPIQMLSPAGNVTFDSTARIKLNGATANISNTSSGKTLTFNGTFQPGGSQVVLFRTTTGNTFSTPSIILNGPVLSGNNITITNSGSAGSFLFASNAGTYTGRTTLANFPAFFRVGASSVGSPVTAGPFGTSTIEFNGGAIDVWGGSHTISNPISLPAVTSSIIFHASNTGSLTLTSPFGLTATRTISVTNNLYGGYLVLSGSITGSAGYGIIKSGVGTLVLGAQNTYNGSTTVSSGTLRLAISNCLPSAMPISLNGGVLDIDTYNQTYTDNVNVSTGSFVVSGSATASFSSLTFTHTTGSVIIYPCISGSTSISLGTGGDLRLINANTYGGATTVTSGTLIAANNYAIPADLVVSGSGKLKTLTTGSGKLTLTSSININGATIVFGGS